MALVDTTLITGTSKTRWFWHFYSPDSQDITIGATFCDYCPFVSNVVACLIAVHGESDSEFEPHNGCIVASVKKALYGSYPDWLQAGGR